MSTTIRRSADYYTAERLPTVSEVFEQLHSGKCTKVGLDEVFNYTEFIKYFHCIPCDEKHDVLMTKIFQEYVKICFGWIDPTNVYDKTVLPTLAEVLECIHPGNTDIKLFDIKFYDDFLKYFPNIPATEEPCMKNLYKQYVEAANKRAPKLYFHTSGSRARF